MVIKPASKGIMKGIFGVTQMSLSPCCSNVLNSSVASSVPGMKERVRLPFFIFSRGQTNFVFAFCIVILYPMRQWGNLISFFMRL